MALIAILFGCGGRTGTFEDGDWLESESGSSPFGGRSSTVGATGGVWSSTGTGGATWYAPGGSTWYAPGGSSWIWRGGSSWSYPGGSSWYATGGTNRFSTTTPRPLGGTTSVGGTYSTRGGSTATGGTYASYGGSYYHMGGQGGSYFSMGGRGQGGSYVTTYGGRSVSYGGSYVNTNGGSYSPYGGTTANGGMPAGGRPSFGGVGAAAGTILWMGGRTGIAGAPATGGVAGAVGLLIEACEASVQTPCQMCQCKACAPRIVDCATDVGCLMLVDCAARYNCASIDCFLVGSCSGIVTSVGGIASESVTRAISLALCTVTSGCGC